MSIRVATFNVENLFDRPLAMSHEKWSEGQPALDAAHELNDLFAKDEYSSKDKKRILELLNEYELLSARPRNKYLELRKTRGQLFRAPRDGEPEIIARGREDWVGWIDLKTDSLEDGAIENTARVIAEVNADVIVLVEVENRIALQRFHDHVIVPEMKKLGHEAYAFNMLIDGNDPRGIDVAILSRFPLASMKSHITDAIDGKTIFARDCPEYYVMGPGGFELVLLPNHFTSKGSDKTGSRRRVQARRVREIYEKLRAAGHENIVVAGDFNDFPAPGGPLSPVLDQTDLTDAMATGAYHGEFPGTYQTATKQQKIDYLLLSPALKAKVTAVDVNRRGYYAPRKWESFENLNAETKNRYQASDHHCVWADLDV
jgi:endonuclease/exonuclease/phosphatase family metal-dependent hydrolase